MANKLAQYKDPEFIAFMRDWFKSDFGTDWHIPNKAIHSVELYQKYHEYTSLPDYYSYRVDYSRFIKCLRASGIIDIGGRWRLLDDESVVNNKGIYRLTAEEH